MDPHSNTEELRKNETLLRELMENIKEVFWVSNPENTQIFYISPAYESVWGRTCRSLYDNPRSLLESIHPDDVNHFKEEIFEKLIVQEFDVEYRIIRPDGEIRWIRARGFPVRDKQGKTFRVAGIAEDITLIKKAQEENSKLAAIVESSEDAIIGLSLDSIITSWNKGAEKLYGHTAAEAIGRNINLIVPEDRKDEDKAFIEKIKAGTKITRHETIRVPKDGKKIDVSLTIFPVRDVKGNLIGAAKIAHNITEQKKLEAQFREAQKMEAVGRLAGGIAHDFNNLLTVINGFAEVRIQTLPAEDGSRRAFEEILKAGKRAADLCYQLLAFSRRQTIQPRILNLNDLVQDMEKMIRRLLAEQIELFIPPAPEIGLVKIDPGHFQQVVINLVVNARDAMPRGGKLIIKMENKIIDADVAAAHLEMKAGNFILVEVSDTGCGMSPEVKEKIFEPFFTTKEPGKGTGLGLATCFGIIQQAGGYIRVYSEPDQGTTFKIYLPAVKGIAAPLSKEDSDLVLPQGNESILIIEDEPHVRSLVVEILLKQGYTVFVAENGECALDFIHQNPDKKIDLVLTDVIMPRLGGKELSVRLHKIKPDIKIIFMSGHTDDAIAHHGILEPGITFIQKPFTLRELTLKIRKVLDN